MLACRTVVGGMADNLSGCTESVGLQCYKFSNEKLSQMSWCHLSFRPREFIFGA